MEKLKETITNPLVLHKIADFLDKAKHVKLSRDGFIDLVRYWKQVIGCSAEEVAAIYDRSLQPLEMKIAALTESLASSSTTSSSSSSSVFGAASPASLANVAKVMVLREELGDILMDVTQIFLEMKKSIPQARQFGLRCLAIREQLCVDSLATGDVVNALGILDYTEKKYDDAKTRFERAANIYTTCKRPDKASAAWFNLSLTVKNGFRQMDESMAFLQLARKCCEEAFQGAHPRIASIWNSEANLHMAAKNYDLAVSCYKKAFSMHLMSTGENVSATIALVNMADVLRRQKKYTEALENARRCVEIRVRVCGPKDTKTGLANLVLAEVLANLLEFDAAKTALESAAAILVETNKGSIESVWGVLFARQGRLAEAKEKLLAAKALFTADKNVDSVEEVDLELAALEEAEAKATATAAVVG